MIVSHFDTCACVSYWRSCEYHEHPRISPKGAWNCKPWTFGRSDHSDVWLIIIASCIPSSLSGRLQQLQSPQRKKPRAKFRLCSRTADERGFHRVETSSTQKWREHERTNQDEPTTNLRVSKKFLQTDIDRSYGWQWLFTPSWDGLDGLVKPYSMI